MREAHKIERLPQLLAERSPGMKQAQAFRRYVTDRMRAGATDDELLAAAANRGSAFHALLMAIRLDLGTGRPGQ